MCGEAIVTGVHRCIPYGTTLHTDATIAQIFGVGRWDVQVGDRHEKGENSACIPTFSPIFVAFHNCRW
jgi:hypothetical protein